MCAHMHKTHMQWLPTQPKRVSNAAALVRSHEVLEASEKYDKEDDNGTIRHQNTGKHSIDA